MKKYDVAIYGLWYGNNYGSIITYFALSKVIEKMGMSYAMIRNPLGREIDINFLERSHPLRFAEKHYEITPLLPIGKMHELNDIFNVFLLGSDQMWNYGLSRPYRQSYFFDFVDKDKGKIAYATSFGKEKYNGPDEEKIITKSNLERFNAISVRDEFSKDILEKTFGIKSEQMLDPVFLCEKEEYEKLIETESEVQLESNYLFAYVLDPNLEIGKELDVIAEDIGKKIYVVFNQSGNKEEFKSRLDCKSKDVCFLDNPTVSEWLALFQNAEFVLTDSFHGMCFSIIFEKEFLVLENKNRGAKRFSDLLGKYDLLPRMINEGSDFARRYFEVKNEEKIDYKAVKSKIKYDKDISIKWLEKAVKLYSKMNIEFTDMDENKKYDSPRKINIKAKTVETELEQKMCTGCSACVAICPVGAIGLGQDEFGYYRSKVDDNKCVQCGKCVQVCPGLNLPDTKNNVSPECYEFVSSSDEILVNSSSGGAFGTMAKVILAENGVVVGAAWTPDLRVEHIMIDSMDELEKLQKSKYLQSYLGDVFVRTKRNLDRGRKVLFVGTPCQISGLRNYLGREYNNLLMIDFLCGNAPSVGFFKKYIEDSFGDNVEAYQFRYKDERTPWDAFHTKMCKKDGTVELRSGVKDDDYQRVYHNHTMCSIHCENCRYQKFPRVGDLTIGDFWGIGKHELELDTFKGVSMVLCNNYKGKEFFKNIPDEAIRVRKQVPLVWMGGNGYSRNGGKNYSSSKRNLFYDAILKMPFGEAVNYALKPDHGKKREVYQNSNSPLLFDRKMRSFRFDSSIWEEHVIDGCDTLIVKPNKWNEAGNYARLSLCSVLRKGRKYNFALKFKIKTSSNIINFHVIDSGSKVHQVIHSEKLKDRKDGEEWIEIKTVFTPDTDYYDEFMIGAAQVSGVNNYIMFAYISISES